MTSDSGSVIVVGRVDVAGAGLYDCLRAGAARVGTGRKFGDVTGPGCEGDGMGRLMYAKGRKVAQCWFSRWGGARYRCHAISVSRRRVRVGE